MALRIVFLYAQVQAYTMGLIKELASQGNEVDLYYFDTNLSTPYSPTPSPNIALHPISKISLRNMISDLTSSKPDIVYVSGWQSKKYLLCCFLLRLKSSKIVVGFDDQWTGAAKQRLANILSPLRIMRLFYSHAWVCGPYQYEYARKLGFKKQEIIFDLLSADSEVSSSASHSVIEQRLASKTITFVGRISPEKGIDLALLAWKKSKLKQQNWKLVFVGNYENFFTDTQLNEFKLNKVEFHSFITQKELINLLQTTSFGLLPSLSEQWGVVMHEFCLLSLPIIAADEVGANSHFLINGFNGYKFTTGSEKSLTKVFNVISELNELDYQNMANNSLSLSNRITVKTAVANLLSISKSSGSL